MFRFPLDGLGGQSLASATRACTMEAMARTDGIGGPQRTGALFRPRISAGAGRKPPRGRARSPRRSAKIAAKDRCDHTRRRISAGSGSPAALSSPGRPPRAWGDHLPSGRHGRMPPPSGRRPICRIPNPPGSRPSPTAQSASPSVTAWRPSETGANSAFPFALNRTATSTRKT